MSTVLTIRSLIKQIQLLTVTKSIKSETGRHKYGHVIILSNNMTARNPRRNHFVTYLAEWLVTLVTYQWRPGVGDNQQRPNSKQNSWVHNILSFPPPRTQQFQDGGVISGMSDRMVCGDGHSVMRIHRRIK